ncbi:P-loop containing nucleoside triphosphate hydrolase protein [Fusarium solani]|uniref:P-loop containing nucleoside triphosphate hydrolase protein n=1 Tax=Fusarium solani TaxID=169388 RepID=A0A9P9HMT6_FUSSL|nr:P-loop containing nucleoside triphosphate hydrolase protein [Fusarium solani]KAH7260524.1 P-loop containing nucleoside triphosphate hydrolase protein [Fusarium solani]
MVMTKLTSDGLSGLCSKEKLQLLDTVDSLRSHGISHYISLPQIIVCGDQSSGKSSVLEAISGVSFPVRSNVCTRFPTELVLRKTAHTGVNVRIVPHHSRPESERKTLASFHETLDAFDELPELIERAKAAMGITTLGKAFSNDLLRIEISGPDRPHLTIVDLPGLIHAETKSQSKADVEMIKKVVKGYMKEPRSVILAVVSAKNDYANQIVLQLAQRADPKRNRTLGVITKPDTLHPGSESERSFINLANNKDVEFRLGWHVLRNRDSEKDSWGQEERNAMERDFFSTGDWASLSTSDWGIDTLRNRLSKLLVRQIASEIPHLINEISAKAELRQHQLDQLGQPRATIGEQRTYLIQIGQYFQAIVKAATEGNYTNPFFEDAMSEAGYQKRFRAVIQNLGQDFAKELDNSGKHIQITDDPMEELAIAGPTMTRQEYLDKIVKLMKRSRGRELPGMFNPLIVANLFREQSSPWGDLVRAHVKNVWDGAREFLRHVVMHTANLTTADTLQEFILMPKLDKIFKGLSEKVEVLLSQHQEGHPITYNDSFIDTLQQTRIERRTAEIFDALKTKFGGVDTLTATTFRYSSYDLRDVAKSLASPPKSDMNYFAAEEVLDALEAYYKVAMKRFIDDVAVEAIEAGLVTELGKLIDPVSVSMMSTNELNQVAGETEVSKTLRKDLETELGVLKGGMAICRQFAGFGFLGE